MFRGPATRSRGWCRGLGNRIFTELAVTMRPMELQSWDLGPSGDYPNEIPVRHVPNTPIRIGSTAPLFSLPSQFRQNPVVSMTVSPATLDLTAALSKFGLSSFRKGQKEVIEHVISGNDCLCVMPTGGGKSLCYQLPSLVRPGLTIVVSPLIALMKDQVDGLQKRGIRATLINSSLSPQEQNERLEQVSSGRFSMLYVAPERLRNQRFLDSIRATPIQLLAIDEAHCISEWGHDFRPDYQRLGRFREALGNVQTIALTATATPRVRADILSSLQMDSSRTFITGFARDNLHFGSVQCMSDREKDRQLHQFLEDRNESGIIYVATRKRCEALVDQLAKELKLNVGAYHAGLLPEQRKLIQDKFMAGELKAIVATNAFGMGIDKSDLRYVVHYNMPGTLEAYYQEAGRAGRDGLQSQCVLLYSTQDRYIQEFFIENANPSRELMQSVYEFLANRPEDPIELTADEIREQIGQSASSEAINSALQVLGRTDVLERLEVAGGLAMFRLSSRMQSFVDLLPRDANVRRTVMRTVEKAIGDRRDEAVYIHPRWMMEQLQMDRDTMSRHLRELCKLEDFEYVPPFRGRAIHFRKRNVHFDDLKIDHAALAARKKADYEKLDQMVAYARSQKCRQLTILEYFGDKSATKCNLCDRCQGRSGWPRMPNPPKAKALANTGLPNDAESPNAKKGKKDKAGKKATSVDGLDKGSLTFDTAESMEEPTSNVIVISPTTRPLHGDAVKSGAVKASDATRSPAKANGSGSDSPPANTNPSNTNPSNANRKQPAPTRSADTSIAADTRDTRSAVQCIQTVLGAIERTHGYLSKTVLTQHFSGTESKAVAGLRLQRLPEFGMLRDWKKSHASGLIDAMLDHGLVILSELKMGKLTISLSELGSHCQSDAMQIPDPMVRYVLTAIQSIATSKTPPATDPPQASSDAPNPSPNRSPSPSQSIDGSTSTAYAPTDPAPTGPASIGSAPIGPATSTANARPNEVAASASVETLGGDMNADVTTADVTATRGLSDIPSPRGGDAIQMRVDQPIISDWQWTLRMARHGYRLGECALIRGKTPDAILADLTVAMQSGEQVSIDQLFDRRTILAIKEIQAGHGVTGNGGTGYPPAVLQVFSSLWPFIQQWLKSTTR